MHVVLYQVGLWRLSCSKMCENIHSPCCTKATSPNLEVAGKTTINWSLVTLTAAIIVAKMPSPQIIFTMHDKQRVAQEIRRFMYSRAQVADRHA